jgi:hypothetical protein
MHEATISASEAPQEKVHLLTSLSAAKSMVASCILSPRSANTLSRKIPSAGENCRVVNFILKVERHDSVHSLVYKFSLYRYAGLIFIELLL